MTATQRLTPVLERLDLEAVIPSLEDRTRDAEARNVSYQEFLYEILYEAVRAREFTNTPSFTTKSEEPAAVLVGPEARYFEVAGKGSVNLGRRGPVRRILLALVRMHADGGGQELSVPEVVEAGWPGEIVSADAGATRVYTAIRTLRRLGLEGILLTRDGGYLIDPRASIVRPRV